MVRQRYSIKEGLNRILRSWQGTVIPSEQPNTLDGDVLSENQAISDLAELFESSLPNQTPTIPSAVRATNAEAIAGTNDVKAITPAGVAAYVGANVGANIQYGEIYTATGTVTMTIDTSWVKVSGSFQNDGASTSNIIPDYNDDRITINEIGTYFVGTQISFSGGASALVDAAVYLNGTRQEQVRLQRKLNAAGDVGSASALGIVQVTGTGMKLEIYVRADASKNFKLEAGQLWTYGLP